MNSGTQELRSILHQSGLKATPGRLAVLELLQSSQRPLSIKAILEKLKKVDIDQATVYRMMLSLKERGIIRQVDFQHGHAHYELVSEKDHHHIVCVKCGAVEDLAHCDLEDISKKVLRQSKTFAKIRDHALEFFGLCKKCALKK